MKYEAYQPEVTKAELIAEIKKLVAEARNTPLSELCKVGDYKNHPDLKFPQTKGEHIADSISTLIASQPWIDGASEPVLDEILDVAAWLGRDATRSDIWEELFELERKI